MTLRELVGNVTAWFSNAFEAVTTKNPVDWPLGLLVIVFAVVLFGWIIFLEWIVGWRRTFARARQEREAWRRSHKSFDPNEIPADPRERLEWANRTGRYAPGADKSE